MLRKTKIFITITVFILQMIMFTQLFVSTSYAALQTIANDDFSSNGFSGGSGWSGAWSQSGNTSINSYSALLKSSNSSITRTVNLSGWVNVTLSYNWKASDFFLNDEVKVIIDDGTGEKVKKTIDSSSFGFEKDTISLSSCNMSSNFKIKFLTGNSNESYDQFFVDNIEITGYPDDYNNTIADADPISINSQISGTIDFSNDHDYFKFTTGKAGLYNIYTTGTTDTYGYLYDSSSTLLSENSNKDSSSNNNFYIMHNLAADTTYYVRVKHNSTGTGSYVLKVEGKISEIFFDGFDSGNFTAGGWKVENSASISNSGKYNGSYSSTINSETFLLTQYHGSITKSVSTVGYTNIVLSFAAYRDSSLFSFPEIRVYWSSNGSSFTELDTISSSSDWRFKTYNLPVDANNNPNFKIKFSSSQNSSYDGHLDNVLITGTPIEMLKVEYREYDPSTPNKNIYPTYRLTNIGKGDINISTIKLRYYYTIDSEVWQEFICNSFTNGTNNVTGTFVKYATPKAKADYYLEVGFTSTAGYLDAGKSIELGTRFQKTDSSYYDKTNDYSYTTSGVYFEWDYVTAYINGKLVWGIPPEGATATTSIPTPTPKPTPTTEPSQIPRVGSGLRAEYYNNINFTDIRQLRIDSNVNFEWGYNSPNSNIDADTFSVKWIGEVEPLYSELYTFYTKTDDGVKLWVDDILLIDNRTEDAMTEAYGTIDLDAGVKYNIRIEYYEKTANATAILMWSSESQQKEVIPQTQLYPPKIFKVLDHSVRTANVNFAVGDFVPLMLKFSITQKNIQNVVIGVDMNVRKQDGTISEFILREFKTGTSINKNMFKVCINNSIIDQAYFSVWIEGTGTNKRLKIRVSKSFAQNDLLQISYNVKVSASSSVFDTGIQKYLDANALNNLYMNIYYEISERVDLGLTITDIYSKDSTSDDSEKQQFKADIKLEDPIIFE